MFMHRLCVPRHGQGRIPRDGWKGGRETKAGSEKVLREVFRGRTELGCQPVRIRVIASPRSHFGSSVKRNCRWENPKLEGNNYTIPYLFEHDISYP
jgi:hypothetical protein